MNDLFISVPFTDLASRRAAAELRSEISEAVRAGSTVYIDLSKVQSLSESYADELFGILAVELGLERLFANVKPKAANTQVTKSIVFAIKRRIDETSLASQLSSLVAAKAQKAKAVISA